MGAAGLGAVACGDGAAHQGREIGRDRTLSTDPAELPVSPRKSATKASTSPPLPNESRSSLPIGVKAGTLICNRLSSEAQVSDMVRPPVRVCRTNAVSLALGRRTQCASACSAPSVACAPEGRALTDDDVLSSRGTSCRSQAPRSIAGMMSGRMLRNVGSPTDGRYAGYTIACFSRRSSGIPSPHCQSACSASIAKWVTKPVR